MVIADPHQWSPWRVKEHGCIPVAACSLFLQGRCIPPAASDYPVRPADSRCIVNLDAFQQSSQPVYNISRTFSSSQTASRWPELSKFAASKSLPVSSSYPVSAVSEIQSGRIPVLPVPQYVPASVSGYLHCLPRQGQINRRYGAISFIFKILLYFKSLLQCSCRSNQCDRNHDT